LATIHQRHRQTDRQTGQRSGRTVLQTVTQKLLKRSRCRLGFELGLDQLEKHVLGSGCTGGTWRISLSLPYAAAMRLLSNHVDHLFVFKTTSTGTNTSAKTRLTSVAIRMFSAFPPPPKFNRLFLCHCQPSLKISYKSVRKFLPKVASRQINRQANNDDYISSFAEVIMLENSCCKCTC